MSSVMRFDEWQDSNGVPVASGAGGVFSAPGAVLQVATKIETTNFSTSSTSFVDATNYELSFTPISATSRLIITYTAQHQNSGAASNVFRLRRDTTDLFEQAQNYVPTAFAEYSVYQAFEESAGSTSARTYRLRVFVSGGTMTILNGSIVVYEIAV